MRKAKIVCTLGPATGDVETIKELIRAGMNVARVNFSHGTKEAHAATAGMVREAAAAVGRHVALLGDLCGPKIRVGTMPAGLEVADGAEVRLVHGEGPGTEALIPHSFSDLASDVTPGEPILIDDGLIRLEVLRIEGSEVVCRVLVGGPVKTRKGMNLPATKISAPALTGKDRGDIAFAREQGFDYLALSFVRTADDVKQAKDLAGDIPVLAKIEKPEAVEDLDAILETADGAMVARGDLGVEVGHEKVPLIQKRIIKAIRPLAKPVITATQMLESMIEHATPTRAEVSDVANAIIDGTDAVMLSAETSVGRYPVKAVETMACIIREVEEDGATARGRPNTLMHDRTFSAVIAEAVTAAAREYELAAIAVYTESGFSASLVSAERPQANIVAFSRYEQVRNRMALLWGIHPARGAWVKGIEGVVAQAERELVRRGYVQAGDSIAVTFGVRLGDEEFQTNMMKLWQVREDVDKPLTRVQDSNPRGEKH